MLSKGGTPNDSTPRPRRMRINVCVKGENIETTCPAKGRLSIGMNIPLMKSSGIRMKFIGIMMFPTLSVGMLANMIPIAAKAIHERRTPNTKRMTSTTWSEKNNHPTRNGITDTIRPKATPAKDFPRITESNDIGAERYLSNVFVLRSSGMTTGPTVEAAQKTVCENRTGSISVMLRFLPTVNVKNNAKGNITPNIRVGGER